MNGEPEKSVDPKTVEIRFDVRGVPIIKFGADILPVNIIVLRRLLGRAWRGCLASRRTLPMAVVPEPPVEVSTEAPVETPVEAKSKKAKKTG